MSSTNNMRVFAVRSRKGPEPSELETEKPRKLYASVASAVGDQPNATGRKAVQDMYKLALLPPKVLDDWSNLDGLHNAVIQAVADVSDSDARFNLELSYRRTVGLSEHVKLFSEKVIIEAEQIWKKDTIFSNYAPEWDQMKKVVKQIDADLGLLIFVQRSLSGVIDIYLCDFRNEKVYNRKQTGHLTNDLSGAIRIEVDQVMKDFLHKQ